MKQQHLMATSVFHCQNTIISCHYHNLPLPSTLSASSCNQAEKSIASWIEIRTEKHKTKRSTQQKKKYRQISNTEQPKRTRKTQPLRPQSPTHQPIPATESISTTTTHPIQPPSQQPPQILPQSNSTPFSNWTQKQPETSRHTLNRPTTAPLNPSVPYPYNTHHRTSLSNLTH